jgi:hypothetical protein
VPQAGEKPLSPSVALPPPGRLEPRRVCRKLATVGERFQPHPDLSHRWWSLGEKAAWGDHTSFVAYGSLEQQLPRDQQLLEAIKARLAELEACRAGMVHEYEDRLYRLYPYSVTVFSALTRRERGQYPALLLCRVPSHRWGSMHCSHPQTSSANLQLVFS